MSGAQDVGQSRMVVSDDARQDWIASLLTDGRSIRSSSSNRLMMALAVLECVGRHQHHPVVLFVVDDDGMGGHDEIRLLRVDVDQPFRLRRDPSGDADEAVLRLTSDRRPSCNHGGECQLQVGSVQPDSGGRICTGF